MQYQSVTVTTPPATEPISAADMKLYLRVDDVSEDALISDLITAARQLCEEYTRRAFINTVFKATLDRFPFRCEKWWDGVKQGHIGEMLGGEGIIHLPKAPIVSVLSITYYDEDNSSAVFSSSNYQVDISGGRIYLNRSQTWPSNTRDHAACEIAFTAGYGTSGSDVPSGIVQAIRMTVAAMYEDRQCFEVPMAAKAALQPYRILQEYNNG